MAIVTNLGGGGFINTAGPAQQTTGQLQQFQATAQQGLQNQQALMQNYLQQLPQLAQQMGYRPEELHLFLQSQGDGIRSALATLGVADVEGSYQGMINEVTAGQRGAGGAFRTAEEVEANRRREAAQQGMSVQETEQHVLAGAPAQTEQRVIQPARPETTESVTISQGRSFDTLASELLTDNKINNDLVNGDTFRNTVQLAEYMIDQGADPNGSASELVTRYRGGDTEITNDVLEKVLRDYSMLRESGDVTDTVQTFAEPGELKYNFNYNSVQPNVARVLQTPLSEMDRGSPGVNEAFEMYQNMNANEDGGEAAKKAFVQAMTENPDNLQANHRNQALMRLILQERHPGAQRTISERDGGQPGIAAGYANTVTRQQTTPAQPAVTQTVVTQEAKPGVFGAIEQLRGAVENVSPGSGEYILPKLDQQQQQAQINYLQSQIQAMQQQGQNVEAAIMAEIQKALIEQDTELFVTNLEQYYNYAKNAFDAAYEDVPARERLDYVNQHMANFINSMGYTGLGAEVGAGNIDRLFRRDLTLPLFGAAQRGTAGEQGGAVTSGEAFNTLEGYLNQ